MNLAIPRKLLISWLVALVVSSCANGPSTQVLVLMDTDYAVPAEVDRIRARVSTIVEEANDETEVETWRRVFRLTNDPLDAPAAQRLPATFGILPDGSTVDSEIVIVLEALAAGSEEVRVSRRARTGFVPGESRLIRMVLFRACEDVRCPRGQTCGCQAGSSCAVPSCVDEGVRPSDLEIIDDPGALPPDAGIPLDPGDPDGGAPPDAGTDAGGEDGGIECVPPLIACNTTCVNLETDVRHCGACGSSCPDDLGECQAGVCTGSRDCRNDEGACVGFTYCDEVTGACLRGCDENAQCPSDGEICDRDLHDCVCAPGLHACGAECVSDTDVETCGNSCDPCPEPDNSTATCIDSACGFTCEDLFEPCSAACCPIGCPSGEVSWRGTCAPFHVEFADDSGDVGEHSSIALDDSGRPHVSHYARNGKNLVHSALPVGDAWSSERAATQGDVGKYSSLAFDDAFVLHCAYYAEGDKDLEVAVRQPDGTWVSQIVDGDDDAGRYASLAFAPSGTVHVSYENQTNRDLMFATREGDGSWTLQVVASQGDVGEYASLAFDLAGVAHISFYDKTQEALMYATQEPDGSWRVQTVDGEGEAGKHTSLAFDDAGVPHISYYGEDDKDLRIAVQTDAGTWALETVDAADDVGEYTSVAIDAAGVVHISYYDETARDLKYAVGRPGVSWTTRTLDAAGDVGRYTSIALDDFGNAHISYRDATTNALKYALVAAAE